MDPNAVSPLTLRAVHRPELSFWRAIGVLVDRNERAFRYADAWLYETSDTCGMFEDDEDGETKYRDLLVAMRLDGLDAIAHLLRMHCLLVNELCD